MKIYQNAALNTSVALTAPFNSGVGPSRIGSLFGTATYLMDGLIDDVRVYNRALSASEIAELYRMDATGTVTTTGALSAPP